MSFDFDKIQQQPLTIIERSDEEKTQNANKMREELFFMKCKRVGFGLLIGLCIGFILGCFFMNSISSQHIWSVKYSNNWF